MIFVMFSDWSRFPAELKIKEKKVRKTKSSVKPNLAAAKNRTVNSNVDITKTLEVGLRFEPRHEKTKILHMQNKGIDQLCSNCEAGQCLWFHYMDSTILLLKSKISSF